MSHCDRAVLLLASRVPQLSLNGGARLQLHILCCEFNADRRGDLGWQLAFVVLLEKAGLAHRHIPNQNDYTLVLRRLMAYFCTCVLGCRPFLNTIN